MEDMSGDSKHYIDETLCKGCGLCVDVCVAGIMQMSRRRNRKGYRLPAVSDPEKCRRCRMCELCCPDMAIYVCPQRQTAGGAVDNGPMPSENANRPR